ncbi:hypothetical protein HDU97_002308 [Phlyctochytrium planicorne]|nr:hypothetical protein HDU97_002308 [Phlyctochytrium planicorne]
MVGLDISSVADRGRSHTTANAPAPASNLKGRSLSLKKIQTPAPIDALLADLDNMIRKQSVSGPSSLSSPSSPLATIAPAPFPDSPIASPTAAKPRDSKFSDADGSSNGKDALSSSPTNTAAPSNDAVTAAIVITTPDFEGLTIQQLMDAKDSEGNPAMIMCGFLQKLSLSRTLNQTKWKRRYFVLTQNALLLFRTDGQDEKAISRIAINATSDTMVSDEEGSTGRFVLEVRTEKESDGASKAANDDEESSGAGPRIWRLLSNEEDAIMGWLIAVQDVIEREQVKAVQAAAAIPANANADSSSTSSSASLTSTPPPLSNASTPASTPPRVSSVKRNPVPLGPVLAMLETKPLSSQSSNMPSPSSSKISSEPSPYLPKSHFYPIATSANTSHLERSPTLQHLHHLNSPILDRRPSINATVQLTAAVASPSAVVQPPAVFMHARTGSHGPLSPQLQQHPQQFVYNPISTGSPTNSLPSPSQTSINQYQPPPMPPGTYLSPQIQQQPTATLHTFNQTPTAMVTPSTLSPMMLSPTSSLQSSLMSSSATSPTLYSQNSSISSSSMAASDRVVGAGAGAFSSRYNHVGVTSATSSGNKKSGGGMDDLMMGGGSGGGGGKKDKKKDAVKGMDALMGAW